jgi:hypothetical protein
VRVNARRILKEYGILIAITTRDYAFLGRRGYRRRSRCRNKRQYETKGRRSAHIETLEGRKSYQARQSDEKQETSNKILQWK